jgi:hypothetical protein
MIPENVQVFKTEGEKAFYRFLQNVAKPDAQYVVWYCPDLDDLEPLFSFNLSGKEMDHLKQLMFPSVRVETPVRSQESYPVRCARLKSLDRLLMEQFIEKANSTGRVNLGDDLLTNLTKLKLIHNGRLTLAAMLLFGNHGYTLHIGRFKAPDTIIDDLLLKAPLLTALDDAMIFIKKHINLSYD